MKTVNIPFFLFINVLFKVPAFFRNKKILQQVEDKLSSFKITLNKFSIIKKEQDSNKSINSNKIENTVVNLRSYYKLKVT